MFVCRLTAKESCLKKRTLAWNIKIRWAWRLCCANICIKWMEMNGTCRKSIFFSSFYPVWVPKTLPRLYHRLPSFNMFHIAAPGSFLSSFRQNSWQTFPVEVEMHNSLSVSLNFDLSSWKREIILFDTVLTSVSAAEFWRKYAIPCEHVLYQFLCAHNLNFKSNQQQSICHGIIKAKTAHWTRFPPKTEKIFFNHHQMNFKVCFWGKFVVSFHRRLGVFPQIVVV